jgi:ATP-dependent 26S proteasome regulatory subunit
MTITLCPAQKRALDGLLSDQPLGNLFTLRARSGMGKTTVLRAAHQALGGAFLTTKEFVDALRPRHPLALEEAFAEWLGDQLHRHECVFLDNLDLISNVTGGCGAYPRSGLLAAALAPLVAFVEQAGKKLIVSSSWHMPEEIAARSFDQHIHELAPEDYECICQAYLGPRLSDGLDYAKIHRFAPQLTGHQLKWVSVSLNRDEPLDTETFIEFLRSRHLTSNVDLREVQPVALSDLKGVEEVVRSLEANIIVPLENDALATELQLKPKRGVLLLGPPGTGKTTVGRALAHRLKSKFFLLDGTIISGTNQFYYQIAQVVEAAKQNAPAVLFIDDSDVIFESGQELGLYRYLLTLLDGLESATAGRVCVMLTAMDVSNLPPALIRSGRIELWLEMRLPHEAARAEILQDCLASLPAELRDAVDLAAVAAATDGLTGADLKRLVEDSKNALAYDKVQEKPTRALLDYLLTAVESLRDNKQRYAQAEATARLQRPSRPVYYDFPVG